jgi:HSP20 family protein
LLSGGESAEVLIDQAPQVSSDAPTVRATQRAQRKRRVAMAIVRWDPMREFEDMQSRLNRLMSRWPNGPERDDESLFAGWSPAVDVEESDKEYLIKADLPEVKKDDVKVMFEDGVLTIEGERKKEQEEKGKKFHKIEREYGKFVRRFGVPNEVDTAKVQAEFKDGVLNVHLPKTAKALPKAVEIKLA